jgi:hypothetical protein
MTATVLTGPAGPGADHGERGLDQRSKDAPVCRGYLEAYDEAERRLDRGLLLIAAPLAAAIVAGIEHLTGAERDWLIFVNGRDL